VLLAAACLGSRLTTTITYVEDPDSLRFALSVADGFDVAALQPHFPGYPVFWAASTLLYLPTGHFSASFSLVGGIATLGLIAALLVLARVPLRSTDGLAIAAAVFFNPLLWLMGNRYMPDLLGTACAIGALACLLRAVSGSADDATRAQAAAGGIVLTGLLAGLRLSYLPLVIGPALLVLMRSPTPWRLVLVGGASVAAWLVPMIFDTGLWTLVDVAWAQTTGHFTEFGGTVQTESDLGRRTAGFVRGLWADGLGAWWPGRHPLTLAVGAGVLGLGGVGAVRLGRTVRWASRRVGLLLGSAVLYAVWVFFFQNVIHKSRHVLPLIPLLLLILAGGAGALWRRSAWGRAAGLAVLGAYTVVTVVLVRQHLDPSALAQAKAFVEARTGAAAPTRVASIPLVNTYLRKQRVDARFVSVDDSTDVRRLRRAEAGQTLVIGTYPSLFDRPPERVRRFYHNPYVNRMWPEVTVSVYDH
jgi:4-amino-4-deoxy-L-arabinose transferase-like glycosyltransferase